MILDFFRTKEGKIVIAQFPNWPLWLAFIFWVMGFFQNQIFQKTSFVGVLVSMLYWSYLEITQGVNAWRKFLGVCVALYFLSKLVPFLSFLSL